MILVGNLLRYMCAKNYQRITWFGKVFAKIKWRSFFIHVVYICWAYTLYKRLCECGLVSFNE